MLTCSYNLIYDNNLTQLNIEFTGRVLWLFLLHYRLIAMKKETHKYKLHTQSDRRNQMKGENKDETPNSLQHCHCMNPSERCQLSSQWVGSSLHRICTHVNTHRHARTRTYHMWWKIKINHQKYLCPCSPIGAFYLFNRYCVRVCVCGKLYTVESQSKIVNIHLIIAVRRVKSL